MPWVSTRVLVPKRIYYCWSFSKNRHDKDAPCIHPNLLVVSIKLALRFLALDEI